MEENLLKSDRFRIKDIAKKAGVSAGTVDRVLHDRPGVSSESRQKVEEVLKQIDYKPNMYASALAMNKSCNIACLIPGYNEKEYWSYVEKGMMHSVERYRDFNLTLKPFYYDRYDSDAFAKSARKLIEYNPDGVIISPSTCGETEKIVSAFRENGVPFVFIDSNIESLGQLTFYGQNSHSSGFFAARILSMMANHSEPTVIFRFIYNGRFGSNQQMDRERGFREYINANYPDIKLHELDLSVDASVNNDEIMGDFFSKNPEVKRGIIFNSDVYVIGEYMQKYGKNDFKLMGYDLLDRNVECIRNGSVDFLIAQQPAIQGEECVKALFDHIILRKEIKPCNYMPITLISRENIDFYLDAHIRTNNE